MQFPRYMKINLDPFKNSHHEEISRIFFFSNNSHNPEHIFTKQLWFGVEERSEIIVISEKYVCDNKMTIT